MGENSAAGVNMNASMCLGSSIAAPEASVAAGAVTAGTVVTLTAPVPSTAGSKIYYAIGDGAYQEYTEAITINDAMTIKAYTTYNGINTGIKAFAYTIAE